MAERRGIRRRLTAVALTVSLGAFVSSTNAIDPANAMARNKLNQHIILLEAYCREKLEENADCKMNDFDLSLGEFFIDVDEECKMYLVSPFLFGITDVQDYRLIGDCKRYGAKP